MMLQAGLDNKAAAAALLPKPSQLRGGSRPWEMRPLPDLLGFAREFGRGSVDRLLCAVLR
jgi:hypothetical protein